VRPWILLQLLAPFDDGWARFWITLYSRPRSKRGATSPARYSYSW
jgi:hypothetical protein